MRRVVRSVVDAVSFKGGGQFSKRFETNPRITSVKRVCVSNRAEKRRFFKEKVFIVF